MVSAQNAVAVIGLSGRFPGASSLEAFWRNLAGGVESIERLSDEALLRAGVSPDLLADPRYVKAAPVLAGFDLFDASFFNVSPSEAELIDPQHRLFLECAWHGLEDAGYSGDTTRRIGVFGGAGINRYAVQALDARELQHPTAGVKAVTGNDKDYLTARVSYKLGLGGPSLCIQTACSTSLVAVHVACRSLVDEEVDIALAGGVSLRIPSPAGYLYEDGGILSPDGHCRAFDADAGGTVFGSGVGIVVLKRLSDALADGDTVRAVIVGSAVNNDGALKAGFTAPAVDAQAAVIAEAIAAADVDARTIDYVEAHGTGTKLGDPIEMRALTKAFRGWTNDRRFCAIGSVKTNVGHLDTAAGVTGLIKTILALEHGAIPPSLNFRRPNPEIDFETSPFHVNTSLREWTSTDHPRRAGVSSFGLGGTNCHVVVEQAPAVSPARDGSRRHHVVLVSARSEAALAEACTALADHVEATPGVRVDDVAFTTQVGRTACSHRRVAVAETASDLAAALREARAPAVVPATEASAGPAVALLFPGQGSQFPQMGAALYEAEPAFRRHVDAAADIVLRELGFDLRTCLLPMPAEAAGAPADLDDTRVLQPTLFAVEYALAQLWLGWGIRPRAAIGHSVGEYAAAAIAGVMTFEDGVRLVARRGALMARQPRGAMLAVALPEARVRELMSDDLSVAAVNRPNQTVVAGPMAAVADLEAALGGRGVACHRLATSHAFHSAMMDPILDEFHAAVRAVPLEPPRIPYVSNLTGTWITAKEATSAEYWTRHLRETVRFEDGLRTIMTIPDVIFLEAGPGSVLTRLVQAAARGGEPRRCFASMPEPSDPFDVAKSVYGTAGELWLAGVRIAWEEFQARRGCRRIPLPGYAFQRQRYWRTAQPGVAPGRETDGAETRKAPRIFMPMWRQASLPRPDGDTLGSPGVRLVLCDHDRTAEQIARHLGDDGVDTITVWPAAMFQSIGPSSFAMDLGRPEHYVELLGALRERIGAGLDVVHLLTAGALPDDDPERRRTNSFYSLLWIAQAIGEQAPDRPVTITIVSTEAQAVTPSDALSVEKALVTGPFTVIPREYPNVSCRWVDADRPEDEAAAAGLARLVTGDLRRAGQDGVRYAWRHGRLFDERHVEVAGTAAGLPHTCEPRAREGDMPLRNDGVYLITGGFGGIGLAIARALARERRVTLALVGRTAVPPRNEWDRLLEEAPDGDPARTRIQAVRELEAAAANVLPLAADVADEDAVRAAVAEAAAARGAIHGVIHAAGVAGGGLIVTKTRANAEPMLRPKVDGVRAVWEAVASQPLDFFVCCSSLQSLFGDYGQSDYCAANAFLDAFAEHVQRAHGTPCLAVTWDTWREVGMAAAAAPATPDEPGTEAGGLVPAEAVAALLRLLPLATPRLAVCAGDLPARLDARRTQEPARRLVAAGATKRSAGAQEVHERPDLFTPYVPPGSQIERAIAEVWQQVLGIDRVGLDDSLFELGGDSVSAVQVAELLQARLGIALPPVRLFSASTVRQLAELVGGAAPAAALAARRERGERRRARQLAR